MNHNELTMTEVLHDPLIRLMLRADGVPLGELAKIMEKAAREKDRALLGERENVARQQSH